MSCFPIKCAYGIKRPLADTTLTCTWISASVPCQLGKSHEEQQTCMRTLSECNALHVAKGSVHCKESGVATTLLPSPTHKSADVSVAFSMQDNCLNDTSKWKQSVPQTHWLIEVFACQESVLEDIKGSTVYGEPWCCIFWFGSPSRLGSAAGRRPARRLQLQLCHWCLRQLWCNAFQGYGNMSQRALPNDKCGGKIKS